MLDNKWVKLRKILGVCNLAIGLIFLAMILTSEGGIENNTRMMSVSWIFIWCGLLNFFGRNKKWATVASIVFYSFGFLMNIAYCFEIVAHLFLALLILVFLVLVSVSLSEKDVLVNTEQDAYIKRDIVVEKTSGLGIAALILGIIGMLFSCIILGIVPCIIGLILAIIGLNQKNTKTGIYVGGLVCSVIGIFIFAIVILGMSFSSSQTKSENTKLIGNENKLSENTEDVLDNNEKDKENTEEIFSSISTEEPPTFNDVEENIKYEMIYTENGIDIYTQKMSRDYNDITISFEVHNSTDKDYSISAHTYAVNNLMAGGSLVTSDADVPAGKKASFNIKIKKDWLEENEIETIGKIDVIFWLYYDGFKEFNSDIVEIKTNMYNQEEIFDEYGNEIYSDDNVSIWNTFNEDNSYHFLILNKSTYNAEFTIDNCSVNDWSYRITDYTYDLYDEPIHKNNYASFVLEINDEFLNQNNIDKINNIEFKVSLKDNYYENVMNIWEHHTEPILLTY